MIYLLKAQETWRFESDNRRCFALEPELQSTGYSARFVQALLTEILDEYEYAWYLDIYDPMRNSNWVTLVKRWRWASLLPFFHLACMFLTNVRGIGQRSNKITLVKLSQNVRGLVEKEQVVNETGRMVLGWVGFLKVFLKFAASFKTFDNSLVSWSNPGSELDFRFCYCPGIITANRGIMKMHPRQGVCLGYGTWVNETMMLGIFWVLPKARSVAELPDREIGLCVIRDPNKFRPRCR